MVIADQKLQTPKNKEVDNVWPGLVLSVTAVNGDWLWVSNGKPGWLNRRHVIPLDRDAIDRLTAMIRAKPNSASLYSGRADVWQNLGEIDIAIGDYNEAIRLDPSEKAYYNNRGIAWRRKDEYDKAIEDFNQALRIDPKFAAAYINRGRAWGSKGEHDKAIEDYNQALRIDPKDSLAYLNRGITWQSKAEYDKAIDDYNQAMRIDPKYASAYNGRAWLRATCSDAGYRDGAQAVADATKACELTAWKDANSIDTLAASYAEAGNFSKAIEWQKKAIEMVPANQKADYQSRIDLYQSGKPYRQ